MMPEYLWRTLARWKNLLGIVETTNSTGGN